MTYGHVCYFVLCIDPGHPMFGKIKIGKTSDITKRLGQYSRGECKVELLGTIPGYADLEKSLLKRFSHLRIKSPLAWNGRHGLTEWCEPDSELVDFIQSQSCETVTINLPISLLTRLKTITDTGDVSLSELIGEVMSLYASTCEPAEADKEELIA